MKINVYLLILAALSLTACQQQGQTPLSPTVTPSIAQTATKPAQTLPPPRATSSPAPTLSPREIASSVLTEFSIDRTREISPYGYCQWDRLLAWSISESAQRKYGSQFFTYVKVICEQEWVLVEEWKEQNLGYSIPEVLGWSADGEYLYFHDAVIPDGCQPLGGFQQNLRQVDLANGNIRPIPLDWTGGIALSPDGAKLVYYDWQRREVGVYDIVREEEQRIAVELPEPMEYWYAGSFTWSPDGQSALFVIQYGDPCFPTGSSIRRVDIQTNDLSTLVDISDSALFILEWTNPDRVLISREEKELWLDPVSGNLEVP